MKYWRIRVIKVAKQGAGLGAKISSAVRSPWQPSHQSPPGTWQHSRGTSVWKVYSQGREGGKTIEQNSVVKHTQATLEFPTHWCDH